MTRRLTIRVCLLVAMGMSVAVSMAVCQVEQNPAAEVQKPRSPATPLEPRLVTLTVGRGQLAQFNEEASRVTVSDPAIADAVVVSPHEVVLNGKSPGHTSVMIWHGDFVTPFDITVEPDLSEIQRQLRASFPSERIDISSSKDAIILSGVVTDADVAKQVAAIAAVHAKSVVNLLQSPLPDTRQVMLQVKFATIDRTALTQIGVNLFSVNNRMIGATTTQQFPFPRIGQ